jgi:hypothetical protein
MTTVNYLQAVQTYQPCELAVFQNANCIVSTANTQFENFQDIALNLGSTINMELTYRFEAADGLLAIDQPITQRLHPLTVDQAAHVSIELTNPEKIFNLDKDRYMDKIGRSASIALAAKVESNVALNANSHVPVMVVDPTDSRRWIPSGALRTESGPYMFFGDGATAINSYQQLQQMIEDFVEIGNPGGEFNVYLPNVEVPAVIGSGLAQFVPHRNEETAQSWTIGDFGTPLVHYYKSNVLPVHFAGSIGNAVAPNNVLTVVSVNDVTGQNVTEIVCTTTVTDDADAIKSGDLGSFVAVSGVTPHFTTRNGKVATSQPVQVRFKSDAASVSTAITVSVICDDEQKGICWAAGANRNCDMPIVAGMKIQVMKSHKCGLLVSNKALYIAMPRLPAQSPFDSHSESDPETGVAMRLAYATIPGQNFQRVIHDCIWASTLVPSYAKRILFPL